MFFAPNVMPEGKSGPTNVRGHEYGDLPVDDRQPSDNASETYASWRPTAIFSLAPFGTRPGT